MKFARQCDCCGKGMNDGYVLFAGEEYYCSDDCLFGTYSKEEVNEFELGEDESESYYTEWEDEDDYQYELIDGELIDIEE